MRIQVEKIERYPTRPVYLLRDRRGSRKDRKNGMPVVLMMQDRVFLLKGDRLVKQAKDKNQQAIECIVKTSIDEYEEDTLRVSDEYLSSLLPPIKMAESLVEYQNKWCLKLNEAARNTGISPGSYHHYKSLLHGLAPSLRKSVDNDKLTFKEARAIADISDFTRQEELAEPFIDERLSSVHVENLIVNAKQNPKQSVASIIDDMGLGEPSEPDPPRLVPFKTNTNGKADDDDINKDAIELAGRLQLLSMTEVPEYKRLRLVSSLRILTSRANRTLETLARQR